MGLIENKKFRDAHCPRKVSGGCVCLKFLGNRFGIKFERIVTTMTLPKVTVAQETLPRVDGFQGEGVVFSVGGLRSGWSQV